MSTPTGDGPDATEPPTKRTKIGPDLSPNQNENVMNPLDDQVQNASGIFGDDDEDASNGQNSAEERKKQIENCIIGLSHSVRCGDANCSKQSCSK